jgi:ankyrin repeat protein
MPINPIKPDRETKYIGYGNINWGALTEEQVTQTDENGLTPLHHAAYHGHFEKVPKHLQDKKFWTTSHNKTTVLMSAFESSKTSWINPKDLTEEEILKTNDNGHSILSYAIFGRKLKEIPQTSLTKKALKKCLSSEEPFIHAIIRTNQLIHLPQRLLGGELLSLRNNRKSSRETAYHLIAYKDPDDPVANLTPKLNIWNKESLTLKDEDNVTPLHLLAQKQPFNIPKEFINRETLLIADDANQTVLHYWSSAKRNLWMTIPVAVLNGDDLLLKERVKGKTPLNNLVPQYQNSIAWGPKSGPEAKNATKFMKSLVERLNDVGFSKLKEYKIPELNEMIASEVIKRKLLDSKGHCLEI